MPVYSETPRLPIAQGDPAGRRFVRRYSVRYDDFDIRIEAQDQRLQLIERAVGVHLLLRLCIFALLRSWRSPFE